MSEHIPNMILDLKKAAEEALDQEDGKFSIMGTEATARFISLANPATILFLLDVFERVEAVLRTSAEGYLDLRIAAAEMVAVTHFSGCKDESTAAARDKLEAAAKAVEDRLPDPPSSKKGHSDKDHSYGKKRIVRPNDRKDRKE